MTEKQKDFWQQTGETLAAGASAALPIALTLAPLLLGPSALYLGRGYVQDFIDRIIKLAKQLGLEWPK